MERFIQHIQSAPVPEHANRTYLSAAGFTSGNDPELRHIFRLLHFLNDEDRPTERWLRYKEQGNEVLRQAILEHYKGLFDKFPDAPDGYSDDELAAWFKPPRTGESRSATERAIRTFRKLCEIAGIKTDNASKRIQNRHTLDHDTRSENTPRQPQLVIQAPIFPDNSDYLEYFEAIKKIFYK